jgi:hypothetical protein
MQTATQITTRGEAAARFCAAHTSNGVILLVMARIVRTKHVDSPKGKASVREGARDTDTHLSPHTDTRFRDAAPDRPSDAQSDWFLRLPSTRWHRRWCGARACKGVRGEADGLGRPMRDGSS